MKKVTLRLGAALALLLALVFSVTGILIFAPEMRAHAAEEEPVKYEKLYYFSDYEGSSTYAQYALPFFLSKVGLSAEDINYYYWPLDFDFEVNEFQWEEITNSYVIFEKRNELDFEIDYGNLYVDWLEVVFGSLKEVQNCKLLIIFGTDEMSIAADPSYTKFLKYADIVINTNVFYTFLYSVLYQIREIYDIDIFHASNMMTPDLYESDFPFGSFMHDYLIPLYREMYYLPTCYIDDGEIYDRINPCPNFFGLSDIIDPNIYDRLYGCPGVAIGTTAYKDSYQQWEAAIKELRISSYPFPVFVLNENGACVADWIKNGGENIFYSGDIAKILRYYVPHIMHDFILGKDLTQYDNWEGACDITFKPILGEDGWMRVPEFIQSWQRIMDEDTASFYGKI